MIVIEEDVTDLEGDVNFLFDEQVIQDERLLGLEQGINVIESDLDVIDDELESGCLNHKYFILTSWNTNYVYLI